MADPKLFLAILVSLIIAVSSQSTCRGLRCPPGKKCGYRQVTCVWAPCKLVRTCISTCPIIRCSAINRCSRGRKKDADGCGTCKCCPFTFCSRKRCPNGFKTTSDGCRTCECKDGVTALAGPRCPAVRPGRVGLCAELCPSSGCPTGQACCSNGCGHVCKRVVTTLPDPRCPTVRPGTVGVCAELCPSSGCPTGQACCSNGCGHVCKRILPTLPVARCPAVRPGTVGSCAYLCPLSGCPAGQACCSNGCGRVCKRDVSTCQYNAICRLRMHCPYGFKEIREGCTICRCNTRPKCPPLHCFNRCPSNESVKDRNGCNTCRCKPSTPFSGKMLTA